MLASELRKAETELRDVEREMVTGAVTPEEIQALQLRTSAVDTHLRRYDYCYYVAGAHSEEDCSGRLLACWCMGNNNTAQ
ncbi:hypothetical protein NDU88_008622 [Pleurodeles waltl]|uniref:Uncharacterized protein n=1 Tax=Pleurodeles waltl TaxID=8319 RepID=A0AAV7QV81_PLEWA|nr:hypothetical protein NDU88_008622 [Pleurodeles waltl]